ncbi:hypothetical protein, partial [Streptomyces caniscabiei]|uniref:hypothetical protein n=1 Tax=Streptomyces caniscabiei TaxID=2746961 RepID=UPI0038F7B2A0
MKGQALADFFAELTPGLKDEANRILLVEENSSTVETQDTDELAEPQLDAKHARFTMGNKLP